MALPKLNTPTYELVLPSTNEKIKFRPFLVKEQKVLLIAQESNDDEQVANAMGHLVKECTFGKVNPDTAPMFDIEYLFLRIRGKAVGETVELSVTCPDDEETKVRAKVNLDEINVQMTAEHTNEIKLSDNIKMFLRYPLLSDMKGVMGGAGDIERVFAILKKCINEIHHGDKIYNRVDITDKELEEGTKFHFTKEIKEKLGLTRTAIFDIIKYKDKRRRKYAKYNIERILNNIQKRDIRFESDLNFF